MPDADGVREPGSRGMGRGLSAILTRGADARDDAFRMIATDLIAPNPHQPRQHFDGEALIALSESIRSRGVLQPLVVRSLPGGSFELIAGERRLRAARLADLERVPAIVRDAEEGERLELALIENVAREDLNPVEEARACATLVEDLGVTKEELARRLGKSREALSNLIRILALPDEVLEMIERGELSESHGRALLLCKDHATRRELGTRALAEGWSARETERQARKAETGREEAGPRRAKEIHPDLAEALAAGGDALTAALGHEVKVRPTGKRYRVEFELGDPSEALELARRLLR